jgi:8-oxo-dGTP pyrophosphatase MutT (NUDIX family)
MKPISCGALFYAYDEQERIGIILGHEAGGWLPFKGCNEKNETYEQTAIREVQEETCYLINLSNINLDHKFETQAKVYMIGLCEVPYEFLQYFRQARHYETRWKCQEKSVVKFFKLESALNSRQIHWLSKNSIQHYWSILQNKDVLKKYGTKAQLCIKIDKPIGSNQNTIDLVSNSSTKQGKSLFATNQGLKGKSLSFTFYRKNKNKEKEAQVVKPKALLVSPKISFAQILSLSNDLSCLNINNPNTDKKHLNNNGIKNTTEDLNDNNIKAAPIKPNIIDIINSELKLISISNQK